MKIVIPDTSRYKPFPFIAISTDCLGSNEYRQKKQETTVKRVLTALFVAAAFTAPAAYAHHDHGWDKRAHKEWKHQEKWARKHGYYAPPPVVYYRPAPVVVYQPEPVYQPYYAGPPSVNFNFRVPLN